jgi:hypothetical protein
MTEKPNGQLMFSSFKPLEMISDPSPYNSDTQSKLTAWLKLLFSARHHNKRDATLPTLECKLETSSLATRSGATFLLLNQSRKPPSKWSAKTSPEATTKK